MQCCWRAYHHWHAPSPMSKPLVHLFVHGCKVLLNRYSAIKRYSVPTYPADFRLAVME